MDTHTLFIKTYNKLIFDINHLKKNFKNDYKYSHIENNIQQYLDKNFDASNMNKNPDSSNVVFNFEQLTDELTNLQIKYKEQLKTIESIIDKNKQF